MHQSKYDEEIMVIELCSFVMQEINRWLQLWYPLFEDDIFDKTQAYKAISFTQ